MGLVILQIKADIYCMSPNNLISSCGGSLTQPGNERRKFIFSKSGLARVILFITVFFSLTESLLAQKSTDTKFIFKTWLFLEQNNTSSRYATQYPIKDSSLFNLFQSGLDIKFDTLKTKGFSDNYIFLSIPTVGGRSDIKNKVITYTTPKLVEYINIPVDNCEAYVLCINKFKGTSYRMKGFTGNDFLSLFKEIKNDYWESKKQTLSIKQFLKSNLVEGLDFECLYKGLTSGKADSKEFPCLQICSDITVTIH
jgi:hypothetical protein